MNAILERGAQLKKEDECEIRIPYLNHVTDHIVRTKDNEYVLTIRCDGASFQSADDHEVNSWKRNLNALTKSIADPRIVLWDTLIRDDENSYPAGKFPEGFANDFNNKYAARVTGELLMSNKIYVTVTFRPQTTKVGKTFVGLLKKTDAQLKEDDDKDSIDFVERVAVDLMSGLDRYEPELLGIYSHKGRLFSQTCEFFAYLINGFWQKIPVSRKKISAALATTRPHFGTEAIEQWTPTNTFYGAMLGIKDYTPQTMPGMLSGLLTMPFPLVLTQSFQFLSKASGKFIVRTQRNRMRSTDDDSKTQLAEMDDLLDDLESGRVVMGEHHFSLYVKASDQKQLAKNIALASSTLNDEGFLMAREDLAVEAAFWAQLPANYAYRPRKSPITSKNWAAFTPKHNFPVGRKDGNHWGDAATLLVTEANTPLYFSYHASDPNDPDGGNRKDVGDTIILGPKGTGKTVIVTAMNAFLQKFGVTSIFFTVDRDSEIYVRAVRGKYLPFRAGMPTGCNPFQLPPEPDNIALLNRLVKSLVRRTLTVQEENEIKEAISWVMFDIEPKYRRLGRILEHIDSIGSGDGNSLFDNLAQWCYAPDGSGRSDGINAYIFDNRTDSVASVLSGEHKTVGFDITDFLQVAEIRGPLLMYLFHLTNKLIDGRRVVINISEFWQPLEDENFAAFMKKALKTFRKKNAFLVLDSQSPSDALQSKLARTLIEQTSTKILLPNEEADRDEYMNGLSLSEQEFLLIKEELRAGSRTFLVKQSRNSVVAKLDLKGFDFELDVLSGRESNILLVDSIIKEVGDDPDVWLPLFKEARGYV